MLNVQDVKITDWIAQAQKVTSLNEACALIKKMAAANESEFAAKTVDSILAGRVYPQQAPTDKDLPTASYEW